MIQIMSMRKYVNALDDYGTFPDGFTGIVARGFVDGRDFRTLIPMTEIEMDAVDIESTIKTIWETEAKAAKKPDGVNG